MWLELISSGVWSHFEWDGWTWLCIREGECDSSLQNRVMWVEGRSTSLYLNELADILIGGPVVAHDIVLSAAQ